MKSTFTILDCTLRDGGYYNSWNFSDELISNYLTAMKAAHVNVVELGFRFLSNNGFRGACAFTTDEFLRSLNIPDDLQVAVMVNGADLLSDVGVEDALLKLFPEVAATSPVDIVRIACHFHEVPKMIHASAWLAEKGYRVGLNLMQIADRTEQEIQSLGKMAQEWPIEVLYLADSMGSLKPDSTAQIINCLREHWQGAVGIHTHDNMGMALENTLRAQKEGASWLDSTVTGMGRGPGNTRTEELLIEVDDSFDASKANLVPLVYLIRNHFAPMKVQYRWGTNLYYYLSGKYGIHPTYIQQMLTDTRYSEEDILGVIQRLRNQTGKKYFHNALDSARHFFHGEPRGNWKPKDVMAGREVLILGAGPSALEHRAALEFYINSAKPLVIAMNTQSPVDEGLIDLRVACHPMRLQADVEMHAKLSQPLITPASMLPDSFIKILSQKSLLDYGIGIEEGHFGFYDTHCIVPSSMVLAYALAVASSGNASNIIMAGFDGYSAGDIRNDEVDSIFEVYENAINAVPIALVTPSKHKLTQKSVYGFR